MQGKATKEIGVNPSHRGLGIRVSRGFETLKVSDGSSSDVDVEGLNAYVLRRLSG